MSSSDYRRKARENLYGKWSVALLAALVAGLLGGLVTSGASLPELELDAEQLVHMPNLMIVILGAVASVTSLLGIAQLILGGPVKLGYSKFLLKMHDGQEAGVSDVFSQFGRFTDGLCLHLLTWLYIALWSLLFVIPGIIATYRYAMAPFILAENPGMTASQAIDASKKMMDGYKLDLFVLDLTFIGWRLLNLLTLGIGTLWLNPYVNAAYAAYYRDINRQPRPQTQGYGY